MMILKPLKLPPMIIESNTAFDAPDGAFTAGDAAASHRRRRHSFLPYMYLKWSKTGEENQGILLFRVFRVSNPKYKK
jgi:hypothetical protein